MPNLAIVAEDIYQLAKKAGAVIMPFYHDKSQIDIAYKSDNSPLTAADKASHEVIDAALKEYLISGFAFPVLSEEGDEQQIDQKSSWETYWCVDPLDGTKEFISGRKEFTVNIALVENHRPILGVIYAPVLDEGYLAWRGGGAYQYSAQVKKSIMCQQPVHEPLQVIVSRRHGIQSLEEIMSRLPSHERLNRGSALKFCQIANGSADLFLRTTDTCEWDNAAGQCIVEEAGGRLFHFDMTPVRYNIARTIKTKPIVVVGDPSYSWVDIIC